MPELLTAIGTGRPCRRVALWHGDGFPVALLRVAAGDEWTFLDKAFGFGCATADGKGRSDCGPPG